MLKRIITTAVLSIGLMASANANLLLNGSFELPDIGPGWSNTNPTDVPGWETTGGDRIEIWDSLFGFDSQEGFQHVELNAHPNTAPFTILQDFETIIGQSYSLSFWYTARNNTSEMFNVVVADLDVTITNSTVRDWVQYTSTFTASSLTSTIQFTSVAPDTTQGNLLDNVVIEAIGTNQVSAPGALMLFSLGLAGLFVRARKS